MEQHKELPLPLAEDKIGQVREIDIALKRELRKLKKDQRVTGKRAENTKLNVILRLGTAALVNSPIKHRCCPLLALQPTS